MKAKYILTALAIPALIAACSNDDFEQIQTPSNAGDAVLQGRSAGQLSLEAVKAEIGDDADTRVVGSPDDNNGIKWMWEDANDKIGAVVTDWGTKIGNTDERNIVDYENYPQYAITNYPFAPNIDGPSAGAKFSTPTAVVSGAYLFYNKYDGAATQRRVIEHEIDRLNTVGTGIDKGMEQVGTVEAKRNFFISPIVDLAVADGDPISKPVNLTSVYSVLHFKLKTDLKGDYYSKGFKINKIVMRTMGADDEFKRKLIIDPAAIATIQKSLAKKAEYKHLFKTNGAIDAMQLTDAEISEALGLVNAEMANPKNQIGVSSEGTKDMVYQLDEPYVFTSSDQQMDLMVLMPAGTYKNGKATQKYEGLDNGVFHMTVYTSEGTYDSYVVQKLEQTFKRGYKYNISRTLIIDGGRTNVNLFDPNEGFSIETTEDYNYVIEYINEHYRDFGNDSKWKTPVLNFKKGVTVDVDAAHFFPEFPVKYLGDATLNLIGEGLAYEFQPKNVILGKDAAKAGRPTIQFKDATSTFSFNENVKTDKALGTDGENYTAAIKLISGAKVIVAEGKEVNFEILTSNTALDINKGAVVNVTDAKALTDGTVSVMEGAKLNANNTYTNKAVMNIAKNAEVKTAKNATNEGEITVEGVGKLTAAATFTNEGKVLVKALNLSGMNDKSRAMASFTTLVNKGELITEASVAYKGTYGGLVTIGTLNNSGKVSNNGETKVTTTMSNTGTVTLESDPYALLDIKAGGSTGKGSIVLADATQYEMFDSYYTGRNNLSDVSGVIETTLNQETYDKVMANYGTYKSDATQETAWVVLNKITLNDEVKLVATLTDEKDFVLAEGATLNATAALTINSLVADGANTALAGKDITVEETVTIAEKAALTNNVALTINWTSNETNMLIVNGELLNKGAIDTEDSQTTTANNIVTVISKTGKLVNQGKLSKAAAPEFDAKSAAYKAMQDLAKKLKSTDGYKGKALGLGNIRFEKFTSNVTTSTDWTTNNAEVTETEFITLITKGKWTKVSGYYALTSGKLAMYLGGAENIDNSGDFAWFAERAKMNAAKKVFMFGVAIGANEMPYLATTWFESTNSGTLDLSYSGAHPTTCWAWGNNTQVIDNAVKIGYFNNEKE